MVLHKTKSLAPALHGLYKIWNDKPLKSLTTVATVAELISQVLDDSNLKKPSPVEEFFSRMDVEECNNAHFVNMFRDTSLQDEFTVKRFACDQYSTLVAATHPTLGQLYFLEYGYSSIPFLSPDFWHTPGFSFQAAVDLLWEKNRNRLHLSFAQINGNNKPKYTELVTPRREFTAKASERLADLHERLKTFQAKKLPRTYLFYGPPGTGKSQAALHLAELCATRVLRLDASGLTMSQAVDLDLVLRSLKPGFLVIDDLDRAQDLGAAMGTLLTTVADLKVKYPDMNVVLTANNVQPLGEALLQPERVDAAIVFDLPDEAERWLLIEKELRKTSENLTDREYPLEESRKRWVQATEGLSYRHLKEIAIQLQLFGEEEAWRSLQSMQELRKSLAAAPAPGTPGLEKGIGPQAPTGLKYLPMTQLVTSP